MSAFADMVVLRGPEPSGAFLPLRGGGRDKARPPSSATARACGDSGLRASSSAISPLRAAEDRDDRT